MSTVAITLAISSVARQLRRNSKNGGAVWDRARKIAPHHLRFFGKKPKAICPGVGPSGAGKSGFRGGFCEPLRHP
jgi:hypothetical protein